MTKTNIESILHGFKKIELEDFAVIFGKDLPTNLNKGEIIERLALYICVSPSEWLRYMTERDLRLLKYLVDSGPEVIREIDHSDYPSILEVAGLIGVDDSDESIHRVWLRSDVYNIVRGHVDSAIREGELSGRFDLERVALGYLNLYGMLPAAFFTDLLADYCHERFIGDDFGLLSDFLDKDALIKLCRFNSPDSDEVFVCSPCVVNPVDLYAERQQVSGIEEYRHFTHDEAREAGIGAPFFVTALKTDHGEALADMLRTLGYRDDEIGIEIHEVWMNAQMPVDHFALFDAISYKENMITSSKMLNDCLEVVAAYANKTPKWILKGWSSEETGQLAIEAESGAREEGQPHWEMPRPTISEGYTDIIEKDPLLESLQKMMPEGFPFGMAIPHVAPDDPCPCGSGLSYKRCHGRYRS